MRRLPNSSEPAGYLPAEVSGQYPASVRVVVHKVTGEFAPDILNSAQPQISKRE